MTDMNSVPEAGRTQGAVVVGLVAGAPARLVQEAARFARLFGVELLVVTVDGGRYLAFDDPTGMVPQLDVSLAQQAAQAEADQVELECANALQHAGIRWSMRQLAGDPAKAISQVAEEVDANLIVVGTRRPGLGETLREFFNGSVAARLSHRQSRSVLVGPEHKPVPASEPIVPEQ